MRTIKKFIAVISAAALIASLLNIPIAFADGGDVIDLGQNMKFDAIRITYKNESDIPTGDYTIKTGRKSYTAEGNKETQVVNVADNTVADTITFSGYDSGKVEVELLKYRKLTAPTVVNKNYPDADIPYVYGKGESVHTIIGLRNTNVSPSSEQYDETNTAARGSETTFNMFDGTFDDDGELTNVQGRYMVYFADDKYDKTLFGDAFDNGTLKSGYEKIAKMIMPLKTEYEIAKITMYEDENNEAAHIITTYTGESGVSEERVSYDTVHAAPKVCTNKHKITQYINKAADRIVIELSDFKNNPWILSEMEVFTYESVYTIGNAEKPAPAEVPNIQKGLAVKFLADDTPLSSTLISTDNTASMISNTANWALNTGGTDADGVTYREGKDVRIALKFSDAFRDYIDDELSGDFTRYSNKTDVTVRVKYYDDGGNFYLDYITQTNRYKATSRVAKGETGQWKWAEFYLTDLCRQSYESGAYKLQDGSADFTIDSRNGVNPLKVAEFMLLFGDQRTPRAEIDYEKKELTNLVPGDYRVTYDGGEDTFTVKSTVSTAPLRSSWSGKTISLVKTNIITDTDGHIYETEPQELSVEKLYRSDMGAELKKIKETAKSSSWTLKITPENEVREIVVKLNGNTVIKYPSSGAVEAGKTVNFGILIRSVADAKDITVEADGEEVEVSGEE